MDPHVEAVIQRRLAGEGSVFAYTCANTCGWHTTRLLSCPTCGGILRGYRGYWGTSAEHPVHPYAWVSNQHAWFYPLDLIREVMRSTGQQNKT